MLEKIQRTNWSAVIGIALVSLALLNSFVWWDIVAAFVLVGASIAATNDARVRATLLLLAGVGLANSFVLKTGTYVFAALLLAGLAWAFLKTPQGSWMRGFGIAVLFFASSFDLVYATSLSGANALWCLLAFIVVVWHCFGVFLAESGINVSRAVVSVLALLLTEAAVLVMLLPFGYTAQAFWIAVSFLFLAHAAETIARGASAKQLVWPAALSVLSLWAVAALSFVSSR